MNERDEESRLDFDAQSLEVAWRHLVDTRMDYLRDDIGRWLDVAELYGREVVVTPLLADTVLLVAETAALSYATIAVSAGTVPPREFDRGLEAWVRDAVNSAIDASLTPESTAYPVGAVAHDPDCDRQGACTCLDVVVYVAERAHRRDPDLASDLTEAALRKAERGAFRSIRNAEKAAPKSYQRLRIDVLRQLQRAARREQSPEVLDRLEQRMLPRRVAHSAADVLAGLLPVGETNEENDRDWQECWSDGEARAWLGATALGAHVLAYLDDGQLGIPSVLRDEGRAAFIGVCVVSVAAHCLDADIERRPDIEELLTMSLARAVGGNKRNGGRKRRVDRTLPSVSRFIESLASGPFAGEPLAPPPDGSGAVGQL